MIKNKCYFNCTIQELKQHFAISQFLFRSYFNCTIQELKQASQLHFNCKGYLFQLHHTGIKTTIKKENKIEKEISIAPYRN